MRQTDVQRTDGDGNCRETHHDADAMRTEVLWVESRSWSSARKAGMRGSLSSDGLYIEGVGDIGDIIESESAGSPDLDVHDRSMVASVG